jgi:hypothetical protein
VGTEWFAPGHEPGDRCDWHTEDGVSLPPLYAEWASLARSRRSQPTGGERVARAPDAGERAGLRILSPEDGDVFRFVPGVDARFATVGLRAGGVPRGAAPRWYVDGRRLTRSRLTLVPGRHVVRLEAGGEIREVSVEVVGEPR